MPLFVGARLDEELHLHLLEFAGAEDEVSGRDLVAEGLADLPDAERRLHARGVQHVDEVHEDALRRLGPQVVQPRLVVNRPEEGLQQSRELTRLAPLTAGAAVRAGDVGEPVFGRAPLLLLVFLLEVVGPVPLVALQTLDERVAEHVDVPGGLPYPLRQDDARVEPDDVVA